MELIALLEALNLIKVAGASVTVRTDSKNLIGWVFGWDTVKNVPDPSKPFKRKASEVKAIAAEIDCVIAAKQITLTFVWVKGHAGDLDNEECDRIAGAERAKRVRAADGA